MSKRLREDVDLNSTDKPPKRYRADHKSAPSLAAPETITTARQLQDLLAFRQDDGSHARLGIASFKLFLEEILYRRHEDSRSQQLTLLREFLDSQKPAENLDAEHPFLGPLWQTWSFASSNHNDHLSSAVAAILALLVKTLSSLLEFKEPGFLLCKTALQGQHLRLIKRGLDAPKNKEYAISPCLRLLTEITGFDGGALAREVYKKREQTFDIASVRRNLGFSKPLTTDEEGRRKPSVRTQTIRYVLTLVKYLHEGGKNDIFKNRSLATSLMYNLKQDPTDLIHEILNATEQYILKDNEIPRSTKATLLTLHNLEKVASIALQSTEEHGAAEHAFSWLKNACTISSYGILRRSAWYPAGSTFVESRSSLTSKTIDMGLDSVGFYDKGHRPDVRNTLIFEWILTLRPHADLRDRELVLTCFRSAPELVAAYFVEKSTSLEPKLTNTWLGYASFMFETINLPIPSYLGNTEDEDLAQLPPQTIIMLENILPRSLNQKVLTKCINQPTGLISLFATRMLILALQKFQRVRGELARKDGLYSQLWREASDRLHAEILLRCPLLKDLVAAFRKVPDDDEHILHKEASARLLRLFYEVAPVQACEEPFDISTVFASALVQVTDTDQITPSNTFRRQTLEHYLLIAQHGSAMKWFNKHGQLQLTPITTLIKLQASDQGSDEIRSLIARILTSNYVIETDGLLDALVASLLENDDKAIWEFVDECLARASRAPVKYLDDMEALTVKDKSAVVNVLAGAVTEQLQFAQDKPSVLAWSKRFYALLQHANTLLITNDVSDQKPKKSKVSKTDSEMVERDVLLQKVRPTASSMQEPSKGQLAVIEKPSSLVHFERIPLESDNRPEILRWARKDLETAFEDGDIGALIECLCSQHSSVRRQALQQLRLLWAKLQEATLEDRQTLSVLVGEVLETFDQQFSASDKPLPYLAGTFASHAIEVLLDPAHHIYAKLNRYLIKSPEWRVSKMPSYWLSNTARSKPEDDDTYWKEVQWVLNWLVDGLRTPEDLDILRHSGALSRIWAISHSLKAAYKTVKLKALELIYRATQLEKGSDTLVTRMGVLPWLEMQTGVQQAALKSLVLETGDSQRIQEWMGKESLVEAI